MPKLFSYGISSFSEFLTRRITVIVNTPQGKQTIRRLLSAQAKTALEYGKPYEIELPQEFKNLKVLIHRRLSHSEEKELILERDL